MVTTVAPLPPSLTSAVRVNIRLCGSVPRDELESLSLGKRDSHHDLCPTESLNGEQFPSGSGHCFDNAWDHTGRLSVQLSAKLSSVQSGQHLDSAGSLRFPPSHRTCPSFDPPSWAVPAQGEARLEPICEAVGIQSAVDLTERAVYQVGRSPTSDVQLMHATSSRRHALLFHHSNGSCYVVDCASAHGTYVNGVRVNSSSKGGVVIPHRVRRGAIIRFGGPGAPSFMLKSFEFNLSDIKNFEVSCQPTLSPSSPSLVQVVRRNTRLNALGKTAMEVISLPMSTKRSFDSIETMGDIFDNMQETQDMRCTSPLMFDESPIRLVSPDIGGPPTKRRRVRFSDHPPESYCPTLISPDPSCDEIDE